MAQPMATDAREGMERMGSPEGVRRLRSLCGKEAVKKSGTLEGVGSGTDWEEVSDDVKKGQEGPPPPAPVAPGAAADAAKDVKGPVPVDFRIMLGPAGKYPKAGAAMEEKGFWDLCRDKDGKCKAGFEGGTLVQFDFCRCIAE